MVDGIPGFTTGCPFPDMAAWAIPWIAAEFPPAVTSIFGLFIMKLFILLFVMILVTTFWSFLPVEDGRSPFSLFYLLFAGAVPDFG